MSKQYLRKLRRRNKKRNQSFRHKDIWVYAQHLNENLPKSEIWFQKHWRLNEMEDPFDKYNEPFCGFIPDLINHKFKYVVEIDGAIHRSKRFKKMDSIKNLRFEREGYDVVRVKAYDMEGFYGVCEVIDRIRFQRTVFLTKKPEAKVILRKTGERKTHATHEHTSNLHTRE